MKFSNYLPYKITLGADGRTLVPDESDKTLCHVTVEIHPEGVRVELDDDPNNVVVVEYLFSDRDELAAALRILRHTAPCLE
jgi:hypothetical protein